MAEKDDGTLAINFTASPVMLIVVGKDEKEFWVHQKLLQASSGFFEACARGDYKETQENRVELLEDVPIIFEILVTWLYHNKVAKAKSVYDQIVLIEAYVLADRLLMPRFQNDIMDQIRIYHQTILVGTLHLNAVQRLELNEFSPLFQYYVQQFAYDLKKSSGDYAQKELEFSLGREHATFLRNGGDLAMEVFEQVFRSIRLEAVGMYEYREDPSSRKGCCYHCHASGDGVCKLVKASKIKNLED